MQKPQIDPIVHTSFEFLQQEAQRKLAEKQRQDCENERIWQTVIDASVT